MNIDELHQWEGELESELRQKMPNHPSLGKIYCSTYEAISAYYEALEGCPLDFYWVEKGIKCLKELKGKQQGR